LFGLSGDGLANALSLLSGEAVTGSQHSAFQLMNQFLGIMIDPFVDGRGAGGPALAFAPERASLPPDVTLAYAAISKKPAPDATAFDRRWSPWGAAYGGYGKTSGDAVVAGSHDLAARTTGFAAGLDYRVTSDTVLGAALAGAGTSWSLAQGLGGGSSDALQAGVYGATRWGAAYLAASLAYTHHWMSTDRPVFGGDRVGAGFEAESFGGRLEGGYRIATPLGGLTPYGAVQAQSFHTPAYSETGSGFALAFSPHTGTGTRSELGGRFDHVAMAGAGAVLTLRGRLAWAHDWVSDPAAAAVFQTLPGASFTVDGARPAGDLALASAGAELRLANGIALLGKFDAELGSGSSTYAGSGMLRVTW
jgi:outer membrane autotransporter protein